MPSPRTAPARSRSAFSAKARPRSAAGLQREYDEQWEINFELLEAFSERYGHCLVPLNWPEDPTLGHWVQQQRVLWRRGQLNPKRKWRLERLGFVWEVRAWTWERMLPQLARLNTEPEGLDLARLQKEHPELAQWFHLQRFKAALGTLSRRHEEQLTQLGLTFEAGDADWDWCFPKLQSFYQKHGHIDVPQDWPDPELRHWLTVQRRRYLQGRLPEERVQALAALGWHPTRRSGAAWDAAWEKRFGQLQTFIEKHGHDQVPSSGPTEPLYYWAQRQRAQHSVRRLSRDRAERLEAVGFTWKTEGEEARWEERLDQLAASMKKHGGSGPSRQVDPALAYWLKRQRQAYSRGELDPQLAARLEALGLSLEPRPNTWQQRITELKAFVAEHGHGSYPSRTTHPTLAKWVSYLRRRKARGQLSPEQVAELEALGLPWRGERRQFGLVVQQVEAYRKQHGHLWFHKRVDPRLFMWARQQRALYQQGKLSREQVRELIEMGFPLTKEEVEWEQAFAKLKNRYDLWRVFDPGQSAKLKRWVEQQRALQASGRLTPERGQRLAAIGGFSQPE